MISKLFQKTLILPLDDVLQLRIMRASSLLTRTEKRDASSTF